MNSLLARFKNKASNINLGVAFQKDRVSLCVTEPSADGLKVSHCLSLQGNKPQSELLRELLADAEISSGNVTIALNLEEHTIHKLTRPTVEASEMNQSVIFLLKDRLKSGMEDAIIQTIDFPEGCKQDDQIMAIETSRKRIQSYVDIVEELGLDLKAIDISELLLGDILQSYPGIENGLALVLEHNAGISLLIYRGEHLYLIRKLSGVTDFISCLPSEGNRIMADNLMLEIQRTLDYYDAQMRQPPLAGVLLGPSFADISPLADYLDKNLAIKVENLDINQLLNLPAPLSPDRQQDCLTACAAAFREETV